MIESDGSGRQQQVLITGGARKRGVAGTLRGKSYPYLYGRQLFSRKWPESRDSTPQLAPAACGQRRENGQDSGGEE